MRQTGGGAVICAAPESEVQNLVQARSV